MTPTGNGTETTYWAERFRAGDHRAVEALVDAYGRRLRGFMRLFVRQQELAEDLVQDVFVRAYTRRATLADPARFEAWIFTMARHIALREMQKKRHTAERSVDDEVLEQAAGPTQNEPTRDDLLRHESGDVLRRALGQLEENKRTLIALRYYSDLGLREIAEIMQMPIGSVGTTISRALASLKAILQEQGMNAEDLLP